MDRGRSDAQEVVEIKTSRYSASHWQTINARLDLNHTRLLVKFTPEQRLQFEEGFQLTQKLIALYNQRKYREAALVGEQALKVRKLLLGEEHPQTIQSMLNLAIMYDLVRDQAHAGPLYRRVLELRKKVVGEHHPDYAFILSSLAYHYNTNGKAALAAPLYRQAMNLRLELFGERDAEYLNTLRQLAYLYKNQGERDRAEELFRQAVAIRKEFYLMAKDGPVGYALSLIDLAAVYREKDDLNRAEALLVEALPWLASDSRLLGVLKDLADVHKGLRRRERRTWERSTPAISSSWTGRRSSGPASRAAGKPPRTRPALAAPMKRCCSSAPRGSPANTGWPSIPASPSSAWTSLPG